MSRRQPQDLHLALGCIEYDMHVLAMSLLMRRDSVHKELLFPEGISELVSSALLVKARSLVEFLLAAKDRGITVKSFGIAPRNDPTLNKFFGFVSQHSAHLDWKRARDPLM